MRHEYINRIVHSVFSRRRLEFALSLGLFSSAGVDAGTRLLLKSIERTVDLSRITQALDAGCGVGVIGVSIAAAAPQTTVLLQDRDALAVEFSRHNAERNGVENCVVTGSLAFEVETAPPGTADASGDLGFRDADHVGESGFDLIVSNLPAKAGRPVLAGFCTRALIALSAEGIGVFVVVNPLADHVAESIRAAAGRVTTREEGGKYTVFHFVRNRPARSDETVPPGATVSPGAAFSPDAAAPSAPAARPNSTVASAPAVPSGSAAPPGARGLDPVYYRGRAIFDVGGREVTLRTVYGVGGFDSVSYADRLACALLSKAADRIGDSALFWSPGQGLIPVYLSGRHRFTRIVLAGRDLLSLLMSRENLADASGVIAETHHLPGPEALASIRGGRFDLIVADLRPIPGVPAHRWFVSAAQQLLRPAGLLVVAGSSQAMSRFESVAVGFSLRDSKKQRGYRAMSFTLAGGSIMRAG